jgi:hypothetical protein
MTYREWQRRLAPPWLQEGAGGRFLEGLGEVKDGLAEHVRQAVLARMIQRAPEDALALIGEERFLPRFPGEFTEAYRARLLAAWEFWRQGGRSRGSRFGSERRGTKPTSGSCTATTPPSGPSSLSTSGPIAPSGPPTAGTMGERGTMTLTGTTP